VLVCGLASAAHGAAFSNGSFELFNAGGADVYCPGGIDFCGQFNAGNAGITGWTIGGHSIDIVGPVGWAASDGNWSLDLNGVGAGSISQAFDTVAGMHYRVSFDLGGIFYGGAAIKTGTVSAAGQSLDFSFDTGASGPADMHWVRTAFDFQATGASTTLQFFSTGGSDAGPALDNISVTAVPEPQTVALWLAGLVALAGLRRRRG